MISGPTRGGYQSSIKEAVEPAPHDEKEEGEQKQSTVDKDGPSQAIKSSDEQEVQDNKEDTDTPAPSFEKPTRGRGDGPVIMNSYSGRGDAD